MTNKVFLRKKVIIVMLIAPISVVVMFVLCCNDGSNKDNKSDKAALMSKRLAKQRVQTYTITASPSEVLPSTDSTAVEITEIVDSFVETSDDEYQSLLSFAGVQKYDRERMEQCDIPIEELAIMPTINALEYFTSRPLMILMSYHDDYYTGSERLLRVSEPLNKIIEREDFPVAALNLIKRNVISPNDIADPAEFIDGMFEDYDYITKSNLQSQKAFIMGALDVIYLQRNQMLMHPRIIARLNGHEVAFIKEFARQHWEMKSVNDSFGLLTHPDSPTVIVPISLEAGDSVERIHTAIVFENYKFCTELLRQYNERMLLRLRPNAELSITQSEVDRFYREILSILP